MSLSTGLMTTDDATSGSQTLQTLTWSALYTQQRQTDRQTDTLYHSVRPAAPTRTSPIEGRSKASHRFDVENRARASSNRDRQRAPSGCSRMLPRLLPVGWVARLASAQTGTTAGHLGPDLLLFCALCYHVTEQMRRSGWQEAGKIGRVCVCGRESCKADWQTTSRGRGTEVRAPVFPTSAQTRTRAMASRPRRFSSRADSPSRFHRPDHGVLPQPAIGAGGRRLQNASPMQPNDRQPLSLLSIGSFVAMYLYKSVCLSVCQSVETGLRSRVDGFTT
jgi:hypothetical protein